MPVYIALQDAAGYPNNVAIACCELLPHIFTLTSAITFLVSYGTGGYFLLTPHKLTPICAFHSALLYPVRTFLSSYRLLYTTAVKSPIPAAKVNIIFCTLILRWLCGKAGGK